MPCSRKLAGSRSALNCGLVRDRGTVRTSTTVSIFASRRIPTNSSIDRVEWPIVKNTANALGLPDHRLHGAQLLELLPQLVALPPLLTVGVCFLGVLFFSGAPHCL